MVAERNSVVRTPPIRLEVADETAENPRKSATGNGFKEDLNPVKVITTE